MIRFRDRIDKIMCFRLIHDVKTKISDGSVDSEHYLAICYCIGIVIPVLITRIGLSLSSVIPNTFLKFVAFFLISILHIFLLFFYCKKMFSYFKKRRIMLGISTLAMIYLLMMFSLSWLSFFFGNLSDLIYVNLGSEYNEQLLANHPEEGMIISFDTFVMIAEAMKYCLQIIGVSLILNTFLSKDQQQVDLPIKYKLKRFVHKFIFLAAMVILVVIFTNTDKDDFFAITAVYGVIATFSNPKKILGIFSNIKNLENETISPEISKIFDIFKLFWAEFYIAWVISIRVHESDPNLRIKLFTFLSVTLVFFTLAIKLFFEYKRKDYFSTWLLNRHKEDEDEVDS